MKAETLSAEVVAALQELAWDQWSQLGISGAMPRQREERPADPEALLLFTLEIGRTDPRLFDEVLDWLALNEPLTTRPPAPQPLREPDGSRSCRRCAGLGGSRTPSQNSQLRAPSSRTLPKSFKRCSPTSPVPAAVSTRRSPDTASRARSSMRLASPSRHG
jgi:hypothetical protein